MRPKVPRGTKASKALPIANSKVSGDKSFAAVLDLATKKKNHRKIAAADMTQKEELRLPIQSIHSKHEDEAASPVADRSAAASPVACGEDERLRRIFGEVGVPPAPHPKFAQYLHGWNTYILAETKVEEQHRNHWKTP